MAYNGLRKIERLNSTKVIDELFKGHNSREGLCGSLAAFPLRCVWKSIFNDNDNDNCHADGATLSVQSSSSLSSSLPPSSVLIVAPKKRLRHAVDRNRMKRQIREAYRRHKHILWDAVEKRSDATGRRFTVALALLCISDAPVESARVEKAVVKALTRISEALQKPDVHHTSKDACPDQSHGTHTAHHD